MSFVVAIDGPAGAGKSTVARRIAAALGLTYLDTGAMYRALAWKARQEGIAPTDEQALANLAQSLQLTFSPLSPDGKQTVVADGVDVTQAIREPEISSLSSAVSALPAVRRVIVEQQRSLGSAQARGVVLEGRDIGTVVFPDADVKVFLTASAEERAARRYEELKALRPDVDYAQILAEQVARDARDSQRAVSPLTVAPDAVVLPTDGLTLDEVTERVLALCRAKLKP